MSTTQMPVGPFIGSNNILSTPWRNYLSPLTAISWDNTSLTIDVSGAATAATSIKLKINTGGSALTALTLGTTDILGNFSHVFDCSSNSFGSIELIGSNSGANGPQFVFYNNSPSPAANDQIGGFRFYGNNATPAALSYGDILLFISTPTAAAETSFMQFHVINSGALQRAMQIGNGILVGLPTGGGKGLGTINAAGGFYINGNSLTLSTTVASLPAAATAGSGFRAFVTDATATTFLSVVAGGGANKVPVVSDGTNWLIG